MTMYLPNSAVHPTGSEPAEFLDLFDTSPMANEGQGETSTSVERRDGATAQLSPQVRTEIARSVRDYITELVASHRGDSEDVRSIIRDLHDQVSVSDHRTARCEPTTAADD